MKAEGKICKGLIVTTAGACCLLAILLSSYSGFHWKHVASEEVPLVLGPEPNPASRWRNACVVEAEQQMRSIDREAVIHDFWYQTPDFDAPQFPPNLTHARLLQMNRCHIQGTFRLRADGYMVFSANSQDRPRGKGKRKWRVNNCPSLHTSLGGGAHLFVANLDAYQSKPGHAWRDQVATDKGRPTTHQIVKSILLSVDDDVHSPDVGSLEELWHPGGIDGAGDFVYVGFDGADYKSYLKVFDMADPANPILVGGRGFDDHKAQAIGTTDLPDGRVLLAVIETTRDKWQVHFYIEDTDPDTGRELRHQFVKAGMWKENPDIGKNSQAGFPFLKYQGLALLRECGSDDIYLVGIHNEHRLICGGRLSLPGFKAPTTVDLYRIKLPEVLEPDAEIGLERIVRRNVRDYKGEGCAGATTHITPEGKIVAYTIEHGGNRLLDAGRYPEGPKRWVGKVQFFEYSTNVDMARYIDGDAVSQEKDLCPDEAEDIDGVYDDDGCPDEDNDTDGIPDSEDRCPNSAEDNDGINDGDGCSESEVNGFAEGRVVISHDRMFSDADDFTISDAGLDVATDLVNWWREYGKADICVLAHTNKYGDPEEELAETDSWADIVKQTMVGLGVPEQQIRAQGYGSRLSVVAPADPEAERLNVRIEVVQCIL